MLFTLADRWGEPDPRKLADLPANIITYWEAYFGLLEEAVASPAEAPPPEKPAIAADSQQFADCMRILGNG